MVRTMSTSSTKSDSLGKERKTIPYKIVILGDGGVGKSGEQASTHTMLLLEPFL